MLSSRLTSTYWLPDQTDNPSTSYVTGTWFSVSNHPILSSTNYWIVDLGAFKHICSHARAFIFLKPIKNANVTLPNHTSISFQFCGDIQLNSHLILTDILFVPQFKYNLLSMSDLTKASHLTVTFFPDHFGIQDIKNMKMIGKGSQTVDLHVFHASNSNTAFINTVSIHTWHNRLGHLSNNCLDALRTCLPCGFSGSRHLSCYICPLAK